MIGSLITISLLWLALFLSYYLLLRNEKCHGIARFFLLGSLVLPIVLPYLPDQMFFNLNIIPFQDDILNYTFDEIEFNELEAKPIGAGFEWIWIYYLLFVLALVRFVYELNQIWRIKINSTQARLRSYSYFSSKEIEFPFSFFGNIFVPQSCEQLSKKQLELILEHENIHSLKGHSLDLILVQCIGLMFPFHPLIALFRRELKLVHEYQVDETMQYKKNNQQQYLDLLIGFVTRRNAELFSNSNYFNHQLKSRLMMMNRSFNAMTAMKISIFSFAFLFFCNCTRNTLDSNFQLVDDPRVDTVSVYDPSTKIETIKIVRPEGYYKDSDTKPEFPGGTQAMFDFIMKHVEYPETARAKGLESKFNLILKITKDGTVELMDAEGEHLSYFKDSILKLITEMPKWIPGKIDGKAVNTRMVLPLKYKLK